MAQKTGPIEAVALGHAPALDVDLFISSQDPGERLDIAIPDAADEVRSLVEKQYAAGTDCQLAHPKSVPNPIDGLLLFEQRHLYLVEKRIFRRPGSHLGNSHVYQGGLTFQ